MKLSVKRTMVVLAVAAVMVGLMAVWMSSRYIDGRVMSIREELESEYDLVPVVAAARDLQQGERLGRTTVTLRRIPQKFLPPDYVAPADVRSAEGMAFRIPVAAGQVISPGYLTRDLSEAQGGFSDVIRDGMRALTFPVDVMSGVGGLLNPGDRIDLMMSLRSQTDGALLTLPLIQNLDILAVGESFVGRNKQRYQHITLEVTPRDSARILQARQEGALTAVLRSRGDVEDEGFAGVMTLADLFDEQYAEYFAVDEPEPREPPSLPIPGTNPELLNQLSQLGGMGPSLPPLNTGSGPIELIIGGGPK